MAKHSFLQGFASKFHHTLLRRPAFQPGFSHLGMQTHKKSLPNCFGKLILFLLHSCSFLLQSLAHLAVLDEYACQLF